MRGATLTHQERRSIFAATLLMLDEAAIRVAIRTTARVSFVLFLGAFLGAALYRLRPHRATGWLKDNKSRFTLGFAASHTVYLFFILALVAAVGRRHLFNELGWIVIVAFTAGFVLIYALAAGVLVPLRAPWFASSRFESFAHYALITVFAWGFMLSALDRPLFYAPFLLAIVTAVALRMAAANRPSKEQMFRASAR